MTEANSKIHKMRTYNEAVNNLIYGRYWRKAIKKELQNLENHQIQEYEDFPPGKKAVSSKQVFKVKYYPDGLVAKFKARLVAQGSLQI